MKRRQAHCAGFHVPQRARTGAPADAGERPVGAAPDPRATGQGARRHHHHRRRRSCNSECVGIHADKSANRFQALEPIRQGVRRHFGAVGKDVAAGLMLQHDHGPNYMSDDFQSEIAFLGVEASPSFVRQPEGNGVAERFIRTLKENLLWVRPFETIEELRLALLDFAAWYNNHWLVARHGHRTPAQIRADQQPAMDQAA
jgi:transposase InsO family protein